MGGTIYAAAQTRKANNKAYSQGKKQLDEYENQQNARYNKLRNADTTQLAANRAALTEGLETLRKQSNELQGRQAVMGGSNAAVAAQKEAVSNAYGKMVRDVAAAGTAYKQRLDAQKDTTDANVLDRRNALTTQKLEGRIAANALVADAWKTAGAGIDRAEEKAADMYISSLGGGGKVGGE